MPTCSFCGRSTGGQIAFHDACQERHHKATLAIPGFFRRILDSEISASRFAQLLHEAAEASFVGAEEFNALCLRGASDLVGDILARRLVTETEEQRLGEILENLNPDLLQSPGLVTLFAKNEILRALDDGRVPNCVEVVGEMPLPLRKTEAVLWIFNKARAASSGQRPIAPEATPPPLTGTYYANVAFTARDRNAKPKGKTGDLVLTNYNIFFVRSPAEHRRFPISRITGLRAHVDAVDIRYANRILTFAVADPWFLANALVFLSRRLRGVNEHGGP